MKDPHREAAKALRSLLSRCFKAAAAQLERDAAKLREHAKRSA